jgi:hypothetical protein
MIRLSNLTEKRMKWLCKICNQADRYVEAGDHVFGFAKGDLAFELINNGATGNGGEELYEKCRELTKNYFYTSRLGEFVDDWKTPYSFLENETEQEKRARWKMKGNEYEGFGSHYKDPTAFDYILH